jgi:uncharacterized protein YceH (UPF0502 family)
MPLPTLSPVEARVLGTLVEKQHTVPDSYPLTLNALTMGCNQKTSRAPVMELSEAEVQAALDSLKGRTLVIETTSARATRYSHNAERVLQVPSQSTALLAVLSINCERLHAFADISAVQGFLDELAARPAGALVAELPRQPHARENRWAQLLTGTPKPEAPAAEAPPDELATLNAGLARLERELAELKAMAERLSSRGG